jgi:hypothetical protein
VGEGSADSVSLSTANACSVYPRPLARSAPLNVGAIVGCAARLDDLAVRERPQDPSLAAELEDVAVALRRWLASIGRAPGEARRRI